MEVPVDRSESLSAIIPMGVGLRRPVTRSPGLTLDLTTDTTGVARLPWLGAVTMLTGTGSWSSGHATGSSLVAFDPHLRGQGPTARPDQWSVGMTATRPGPWGTLFSGTVTARRQVEPNTLLGDVTGMLPPGASSWSLMFDPTRSTMMWDTRVRLDRTVKVRAADLTFFGEAYKSFQGASQGDSALIPLPVEATQGLRTGTAVRVGLRVGF